MLESLKHWFTSIPEQSRLFRDSDDEMLHSALASLLWHFIALDDRHNDRAKHEFDRLMMMECGLDQEQSDYLWQAASSATGSLSEDLETINDHMKENPSLRLRFMQQLLELIDIHGIHTDELELFYTTLHEVFPEVKAAPA